MRKLLLLIALALVVAAPVRAQTDEAAVRETIQAYFDGLMQYDAAALARAFHADALILAQSARGTYRSPFAEWSRFVEHGEAPEDATGYHNRILSIDIAGNAAAVKTELDWPTVRYVDYLSLLRIDGQWKIVNKIYWSEPRG